jgi:competence protein ComEA
MRPLKSSLLALSFLFSLSALAESVDINAADASTLAGAIKGIGPARAAAIVQYRNEHGPFKSVDDLKMVKGVGEKLVEANRASLKVGAQ